MAKHAHRFMAVALWDDTAALVADRLRAAVAHADLLEPAAAVYLTGHERRARAIRHAVRADFPEGTPERVARNLLARLAPDLVALEPVERDFLFFELIEKASSRAPSRALVNALLAAFKLFAANVPPAAREHAVSGITAMGERGKLFSDVAGAYLHQLRQQKRHDPEDALWQCAEVLKDAPFCPMLAVVDELESVNPARLAFIEAVLRRAAASLCVLRGPHGHAEAANTALEKLVRTLGGGQDQTPALPGLPRAGLVRAWLDEQPRQPPHALRLLAPDTRALEVNMAARAIKHWASQGTTLDEICVALPRAQAYRALIEIEFAAAGIPYDMPDDTPLSGTPPVTALLQLMAVARGGLDRLRLFDALTSPWLPFGGDSARLARLRSLTRQAGIVDGTRWDRDWAAPLAPHLAGEGDRADAAWLGHVVTALAPFARERQRAGEFFEAVLALVEAAGVSRACARGGPAGGAMPAPALALHEFVSLCGRLKRGFEQISGKARDTAELFRALLEQAQTLGLRPGELTTPGVRVLGLLDLAQETYQRVLVLGLTDADLPLPERDDFFFTPASQAALARAVGEQAAQRLVQPLDLGAQADWLYARALASGAKELVLSAPRHEGEQECVHAPQHARLLRLLDASPQAPASPLAKPVSAHGLACAAARLEAAQGVALALTPSLRAGLHGRRIELARSDAASGPGAFEGAVGALAALGERFAAAPRDNSRPYSPSQLDKYAACPQQFWLRYVLGIKEVREPTRETQPWAVGTLVHAALHQFVLLLREELKQPQPPNVWRRAAVRAADLGSREAALGLMRAALEKARTSVPTPGPFWAGVLRALARGLDGRDEAGLLARVIDVELERNAAGLGIRWAEFTFGRSEYRRGHDSTDVLNEPLALEIPGGRIWITGSIDRVDEGPEGLVVIDYKANTTRRATEIRDGEAFQLPVYLAALARGGGLKPGGMSYWRVPLHEPVKPSDATRAKANAKEPAFNVAELVGDALPRRLARMLAAMREGVFIHVPFARQADTCRNCDFAESCARRDDVVEARRRRTRSGRPPLPATYLPEASPEDKP